MINKVIEGTITLVLAYLIIANASNFSKVVSAITAGYIGSVKALQGR